MRCMLMIAPYRARVQHSAVTTASPFLHQSTTLGIPPPQSRDIREHHGHRKPSTPVHGRGHPSTAVTAVHGRQQLFISVHGRHGCPWPSTAVTAVHGRPRLSTGGHGRPRPSTAVRVSARRLSGRGPREGRSPSRLINIDILMGMPLWLMTDSLQLV